MSGAARRRIVAMVVPCAVAVVVTGCGDDGPLGPTAGAAEAPVPAPVERSTATPSSDPTGGTSSAAPGVVEIVALDNTFRPNQLTVSTGTEVHFVNRGRNEHDVLSIDDGGWGVEAADFGSGDEYVHVFEEPGTYRYYCSLHGIADVGMIGEIVVEETGD